MKKIIFIIMMLMTFSAFSSIKLTQNEQKMIQSLDCQQVGYKFNKTGELLFTGPHKQLYLVKNSSYHTLYLDFPAGHIGASAWITQMLPKKNWIGYLYIPGKDKLPIAGGKKAKAAWVCASDVAHATLPCQQLLYVCQVKKLSAMKKNIILQSTQSWWSGDAQKGIKDVFKHWEVK